MPLGVRGRHADLLKSNRVTMDSNGRKYVVATFLGEQLGSSRRSSASR